MIKLSKKLLRTIGRTNGKYALIGEGDKILVGLSGGKDSLTLIHALKHIQRHAPFNFEFQACTIQYGMEGESYDYLTEHCAKHDIPYAVYETNIFDIAQDTIRDNSSYCSYFSRMRRGALYTYATERGFNKVALGHHLDDAVESFFMNMLYNGTLRSMPAIYKSNRDLYIIRPLLFTRETQLRAFAVDNGLQTIGDEACPAMQKTIKAPFAREKIKMFLEQMEGEFDEPFKKIKTSLEHIHDYTFFDETRYKL